MKKQNFLGIILLVILLVIQINNIYKKSYSGYMFNPNYKVEKVNIDYVVLAYNLSTINKIIPSSKDTVMSVIFANEENKYDICLQYYFNTRLFYPMKMPKYHRCMQLSNYTDEQFLNSIIENKNDYIVIVGKNSSILNITTLKDISIYRVTKENNLELVADYNNDLYDLRKNSIKYNDNNYNEVMNFIKNYIDNYSYLYGSVAYEYLYDYANKLIETEEKELAIEFYNQYLELPLINTEIILNKAKIYSYFGDYNNSLFLIDYCNTLADCDKQAAQEIRNSMEVK